MVRDAAGREPVVRAIETSTGGSAEARRHASQVAVVAALAATAMLFASLVSAYLVRRSFADWGSPSLPLWPIPLLGCALLASAAMEGAVGNPAATRSPSLRRLGLASLTYLLIALGAVSGTLLSGGISAPHDAFIVLLLSLHVVHALVGATFAAFMLRPRAKAPAESALGQVRLVTHFLTALLIGILLLLFGLR